MDKAHEAIVGRKSPAIPDALQQAYGRFAIEFASKRPVKYSRLDKAVFDLLMANPTEFTNLNVVDQMLRTISGGTLFLAIKSKLYLPQGAAIWKPIVSESGVPEIWTAASLTEQPDYFAFVTNHGSTHNHTATETRELFESNTGILVTVSQDGLIISYRGAAQLDRNGGAILPPPRNQSL